MRRWSEVGMIAVASHGHLKQLAPCPEVRSRTRPRRTWTRNSEGFAVTTPQRFVFSGSSTGRPVRQPSPSFLRSSRRIFALLIGVTVVVMRVVESPPMCHPRRYASPAPPRRDGSNRCTDSEQALGGVAETLSFVLTE